MKKLLLAGAVLAVMATPALAQSYAPDIGAGTAAPADYGYGTLPARRPLNYVPGYGGYGAAAAGTGYGSYAMADAGTEAYAMAGPIVPGAPVVGPNSRCWVSTFDSRGNGYFGRCGSWNNDTDSVMLGTSQPNTSLLPPG